jgi:hypothetical protein
MALRDDTKSLVEILAFVGELLARLVKELPADEQRSFARAWQEVEFGLRRVIEEVDRIDSEQSMLWRVLHERGLTGPQLALKRERLDKARRTAEKTGIWGRVLKLINSILGSLSVIPGVDPVKEFKEMIEDTIEE